MSMTKIAGVLTLSAFTVLGAFACSSSSSDSGGPSGGCTGSSSGTGSAACGSCVQAKCGSQYGACFGSGGQCSSFVSGGCKGLPDSTCMSCLGPLTDCQNTNCASDCKSGGSDAGGTDTGGGSDAGSKPNPTTTECKTLLTCCDATTFPGPSKPGCYFLAGADDTKNCTDAYNGFKGAGYCP